jgi:hypothetical protein
MAAEARAVGQEFHRGAIIDDAHEAQSQASPPDPVEPPFFVFWKNGLTFIK